MGAPPPASVLQAVEAGAARKAFDLSLPQLGPYRLDFTRSGRHMLLAGRKGHLALVDWQRSRLICEVQVRGVSAGLVGAPCGYYAGKRGLPRLCCFRRRVCTAEPAHRQHAEQPAKRAAGRVDGWCCSSTTIGASSRAADRRAVCLSGATFKAVDELCLPCSRPLCSGLAQVRETTHDVTFLHNEQFFAAAQKKYTYIYDKRGLEVHCLKVRAGAAWAAPPSPRPILGSGLGGPAQPRGLWRDALCCIPGPVLKSCLA